MTCYWQLPVPGGSIGTSRIPRHLAVSGRRRVPSGVEITIVYWKSIVERSPKPGGHCTINLLYCKMYIHTGHWALYNYTFLLKLNTLHCMLHTVNYHFCIQEAHCLLIFIQTPTNHSPSNTDKYNQIPHGQGQAILSNTFSEKPLLFQNSFFGVLQSTKTLGHYFNN